MAFWETAEERNPSAPASVSELDVAQLEFARIWKQLPKLVFSKSLEAVEGNARLSRADPVQTVQALKEEDGGPIAVGGADLAATLTAHQFIDEYHLFVYPVALGGGKPFFADHTRVNLELLETRTFSNRVVLPPLPPCVEAVALASFRNTRPTQVAPPDVVGVRAQRVRVSVGLWVSCTLNVSSA